MSSPLVDCELRPFYLFRIILIVLTFHSRVQSVKFLTSGTKIDPIFRFQHFCPYRESLNWSVFKFKLSLRQYEKSVRAAFD